MANKLEQQYFVGDNVLVQLNNGVVIPGTITEVEIAYDDEEYPLNIEDINYHFKDLKGNNHWCYQDQILEKI